VSQPIFVDGGLVSNFPIAEFHRGDGGPPDAPTFGVRLLSLRERDAARHPGPPKDVFRFVAALINTARHALDSSFIAENPEYARLVQVVDTADHDWLAFDMAPDEQADLFGRGVEAAVDFLEGFTWDDYLEVRREADAQRQRLARVPARSGWAGSARVTRR
jgi:NTE family protein